MPLIISIILLYCTREKNPLALNDDSDFAIFISVSSLYGNDDFEIEILELQETPLLISSDINSYIWNKHEIIYSESVYERLSKYTDLLHKGFVVTVGKERIYWGLFQSFIDSYASSNPVIFLNPRSSNMAHVLSKSIIIHRSYFNGEGLETKPDPRSDKRIYNSLKRAGKLN